MALQAGEENREVADRVVGAAHDFTAAKLFEDCAVSCQEFGDSQAI